MRSTMWTRTRWSRTNLCDPPIDFCSTANSWAPSWLTIPIYYRSACHWWSSPFFCWWSVWWWNAVIRCRTHPLRYCTARLWAIIIRKSNCRWPILRPPCLTSKNKWSVTATIVTVRWVTCWSQQTAPFARQCPNWTTVSWWTVSIWSLCTRPLNARHVPPYVIQLMLSTSTRIRSSRWTATVAITWPLRWIRWTIWTRWTQSTRQWTVWAPWTAINI